MKKRRKGFTLVELMVVIAIMAILAAASAPVFTGYVRKAKATAHLAECRSIYVAVQTCLEELRMKSDDGILELSDIDTDDMLEEVRSLSGIQQIEEGRRDLQRASLPEGFYIELDDPENGAECTAVIYSGDGIWVFDPMNGSFTELK